MKIIQEDLGRRGVFKAVEGGREIGEMSYYWQDEDTFCIDHTGVDEAYEGQGIGKRLVSAAVDYARKNNKKIIPQCRFAAAIFRRTPEYRDVEAL